MLGSEVDRPVRDGEPGDAGQWWATAMNIVRLHAWDVTLGSVEGPSVAARFCTSRGCVSSQGHVR